VLYERSAKTGKRSKIVQPAIILLCLSADLSVHAMLILLSFWSQQKQS